jgi:hypothetical protein
VPPRLVFRVHAIVRMFERGISEEEVRETLKSGETIERYPDDSPYPSRLILGWRGGRPIHVVAADNVEEDETIVITVYEPDAALWEPDFRRRKR